MGFLKSLSNGEKCSIRAPYQTGRVLLTSVRTGWGEFCIFWEMWRNGFGSNTQKVSYQFTQLFLVPPCHIPVTLWTSRFTRSLPLHPFPGLFPIIHVLFNKYLSAIHVLEMKHGIKNKEWWGWSLWKLTIQWGKQIQLYLLRPRLGMATSSRKPSWWCLWLGNGICVSLNNKFSDNGSESKSHGENQGSIPELPRESLQE